MKKYYIGIDIGGTNTKIGLLGKRLNLIKKVVIPTELYKTPRDLITAIAGFVRAMLRAKRVKLNNVRGIGIGIAGLVDMKRGVVINLTNIPGWRNVNIRREFQKRLKLPVYVDNDVNVMTLAELYRGAGRGSKNLICITLGTGVGGGVVINGALYRGSTSAAGEIGHIPINEKGPKCNCGGIACIESYIGSSYLMKDMARAIRKRKTILKKMAGRALSNLTPELIDKAAMRGDLLAINFWKEAGNRLGVALTGVVNLLNPDKIIIGGGIAGAGRFLFTPIKKTIGRRAMELQRRRVKIVKAKLGKDAGLIGGAVLVNLEKDK